MTVRPSHGHASTDTGCDVPGLQAAAAYLGAVYRFSRPHTIIGTFISVCSVSALALVHLSPLLPDLCMWVCGSGL